MCFVLLSERRIPVLEFKKNKKETKKTKSKITQREKLFHQFCHRRHGVEEGLRMRRWAGRGGAWGRAGAEGPPQWDSPLTELPSPRGEEERDRPPLSVFSELELFWLWWSAAAEAEEAEEALDDVAEVDEGRAFSLKSVMITVRSPTVTSRCWALLRSMFFNRGLARTAGEQ